MCLILMATEGRYIDIYTVYIVYIYINMLYKMDPMEYATYIHVTNMPFTETCTWGWNKCPQAQDLQHDVTMDIVYFKIC